MNKNIKNYRYSLSLYPTAFMRLQRFICRKNAKKCNFLLDGGNTPRYSVLVACRERQEKGEKMAPSKRAREKRVLHLWIDAELHARIKRLAKERGRSMCDIIVEFLVTETKNVELTEEDYEEIIQRLKKR